MSPATAKELKSWLSKRLDAYERYGHLVAAQAAAWVDDEVEEVRALDETKAQLLAWLKLDEPPFDLDRAVQLSPELVELLATTRGELARVSELERAYQRALEGILVDTRTELAKLADNPRETAGYGVAGAVTGSALDLTR